MSPEECNGAAASGAPATSPATAEDDVSLAETLVAGSEVGGGSEAVNGSVVSFGGSSLKGTPKSVKKGGEYARRVFSRDRVSPSSPAKLNFSACGGRSWPRRERKRTHHINKAVGRETSLPAQNEIASSEASPTPAKMFGYHLHL